MNNRLSRLIMMTVIVACAASGFIQPAAASTRLPFDDISASFAQNEIIDLYNRGILSGTSATRFSPAKSMTRAEFITALDRMLGLEPVGSPVSAYSDVAQSAWYYGWIQAAVQLQLASGVSVTEFAPSKEVTRQEAAVLITRAVKQTAGHITSYQTAFKDKEQIADWARASVSAVYELALMRGDGKGNFRPTDPITRQEAALIIYRVLHNDDWSAELINRPDEKIVIGWQYGQTAKAYMSNIQSSNVNTLSPRWYFVDKTGNITDLTDMSLVTWAEENDKQIWAMVGNSSDQEATHHMLSNSTARHAAINQLTALVERYHLEGLNIDFENVAPVDRILLTEFITLLAEKLHTFGATLSIDVSPDRGTDWTEAFDYAALGEQADYIVMMGYDEFYGGSVWPGPNASLPYVEGAVNKLLKAVPSDKVILALPFYNRDWELKQNGTAAASAFISLDMQNQMLKTLKLKPVWNETLGQYVASYKKQSIKHTIWFEDGRSIIAKYNVAVKRNLAGVAYWYIGGESSDIWTSLRNAQKFLHYSF